MSRSLFAVAIYALLLSTSALPAAERTKVFVPSSIDGEKQTCYVILPPGYGAQGKPAPLLVSLHTWSGNVEQRNAPLEAEAATRGWILLYPDFRGRNDHPQACGSQLAQQDILDAVAWARKTYNVDSRRIYLTGVSGGGHMTMLMAGRHPDVWAAASAWVGISDLSAWHARHENDRYGEMLRKCCEGRPGDSPGVDAQYKARSPLAHLHRAVKLPLDIAAGVHDGHQGSVPVRHSLDAFNAIAKAAGEEPISDEEIAQISRVRGRLKNPRPSDQVEDETFGRAIYLRRTAAASRVTIFEGGHEGLAHAAAEWLAAHAKRE